MKTGRGALAEYALVDPAFITKKPRNLSFEEASGIPVAFLTALQALTVEGGLRQGDGKRIFIVSRDLSGGEGVCADHLSFRRMVEVEESALWLFR